MTEIYIAKTDALCSKDAFDAKYKTLPQVRKEKVDRIKNANDKRLSLGAWLLLSHVMEIKGIESDAEISYNEFGKPFFVNSNFKFNLSHSGDTVMCAVSETDVGCDVQIMREIDLKIAERFFSEDEKAELSKICTHKEKIKYFYKIWSLKESFIKAVGKGMSLPLRDISFDVLKDISVKQDICAEKFYFKHFFGDEGYSFACCSKSEQIAPCKSIVL